MTRPLALLAALALVAFGLAACGGSDDANSPASVDDTSSSSEVIDTDTDEAESADNDDGPSEDDMATLEAGNATLEAGQATLDAASASSEGDADAGGSGVTLANFQALETGMSYEEVVQILGSEGTEMSRTDLAGIVSVMYMWEGEGMLGANMNAMFQNGELMSKSQFGLE